MPTPTPWLQQRLQHLPLADQLAWLDRWSTAILNGENPPPLPDNNDTEHEHR